jgi:hypothetical protein
VTRAGRRPAEEQRPLRPARAAAQNVNEGTKMRLAQRAALTACVISVGAFAATAPAFADTYNLPNGGTITTYQSSNPPTASVAYHDPTCGAHCGQTFLATAIIANNSLNISGRWYDGSVRFYWLTIGPNPSAGIL